ncbi:hypothetical protein HUU59_07810 [bacterium]|nr:hypothetical protein [bacterium]
MRFFKSFAVTLTLIYTTLALAQTEFKTVSQSDFSPLIGKWSGTLTYLDYADDSSRVQLEVRMDVTDSDSGFVTRTTFVEPNGEEIEDTGLLGPSHGGKRVMMDGRAWMLYDKKSTANGMTIVFQGPGQDDNKNAQLTHVLFMSTPGLLSQDSVVLTKKVLYENAGLEIQRNQFRLGRVKE